MCYAVILGLYTDNVHAIFRVYGRGDSFKVYINVVNCICNSMLSHSNTKYNKQKKKDFLKQVVSEYRKKHTYTCIFTTSTEVSVIYSDILHTYLYFYNFNYP